MKIHPLANLFPDMAESDFNTLVADIKANGLLEPIAVYKDEIIDGKHRFKACAKAKVKPKYVEYTGDDPLGFVISKNLSRRHLELRDKAFLGAQIAGLTNGQTKSQVGARAELSMAQVADLLGVSIRSITCAREILATGSAKLIADARAGEIPLSYAAVIAKLKKSEQSDPRKRKAIITKERKKKDRNKEAPLNSFAWSMANSALRTKWIDNVGVKSIWEAMTDAQKDQLLDIAEAEQAEDERFTASAPS